MHIMESNIATQNEIGVVFNLYDDKEKQKMGGQRGRVYNIYAIIRCLSATDSQGAPIILVKEDDNE